MHMTHGLDSFSWALHTQIHVRPWVHFGCFLGRYTPPRGLASEKHLLVVSSSTAH